MGDYLFSDTDFIQQLSTESPDLFDKVWNEVKYLCKVATAGSKEAKQLLAVQKKFEEVYRAAGAKNTVLEDGVKYQLNKDARTEVHKALHDKNYQGEVLLRDVTPAIMLAQKGVKNLPMAMNASHIRENVFTEAEAKANGLRVDSHTHYHGLGEDFFLKVIDGLDNVKEAYRGTKNASDPARGENYFLLISEFTHNGNTVNVPVYVNEHARVNRVFIDVNKISTVFGRDNFRDFIARQVRNQDLVRIKNRSIQSSESNALIARGYRQDTSNKSRLAQDKANVNQKNSLSSDDLAPVARTGEVYGSDIGIEAPVREDISGTETTAFPDDLPIREDIQVKTTKQKLEAIRENSRQELARNEQLRQEAHDGYTKKIEDAQAKYDAKKNKDINI